MFKFAKKAFAASLMVTAFLSSSASAGIINWSTLNSTSGNTATVAGVGTVTSQGGDLALKSRKDKNGNVWQGFGATNVPTGEIGIGQSITINFNSSQKIRSFELAYLWPKDLLMKDTVDEAAKVSAYFTDGSVVDFLLQATSATFASWNGFGSVTNLSPADVFPNAGVWKVSNPFENASVSKIVFSPLMLGDSTSLDSDFSIVSVSVVSEPSSIALFSLVLLGLIGIKRKNYFK